MTERPSIFPQFSVNVPMPAGVKPPKGSVMPADIAAAIDAFDNAAQFWGWQAEVPTDGTEAADAIRQHAVARAALDALILKHLGGEA